MSISGLYPFAPKLRHWIGRRIWLVKKCWFSTIYRQQGMKVRTSLFQVSCSHLQLLLGIWTKHLKTKTELHQTVIDRCLKSLTQKQLVKSIKNVKVCYLARNQMSTLITACQYPTRKIYMLFNLEPSAAITGGPWYTDSELDTEFINLLASACLKFIQERVSHARLLCTYTDPKTLL